MSSISNLNRMAGLMSGLDTEALVKAMTANTMARINSQKQKLQLLQWKQESYRSVISKISDFKSKYLDILSPTSIKAQAVMNKYKATSSNDKLITATAAAGAAAGKYTIKSATSAKAATVTSNGSVAAGKIDLDFSKNVNGKDYTVYVTLDGTTKGVTFKGSTDEETAKKNFLEAANAAFSGTMNSEQAFKFDGNSLYFDSNGDGINHTFSVSYNSEGVGLKNNAYSQISTSSTLDSIAFNQALKTESGTYNININGINFEFYGSTTIGDMMNTINNSNAGVKMSFSNISQSFTLETTQTGAGSEIKMYQSHGNLLNALFNIDSDKLNAIEPDKGAFTYMTNKNAYSDVSTDLASKLKNGFDEEDETTYKMKITVGEGTDAKEYELELDLSSFVKKDDETYSDDEISSMLDMIIKQKYSEVAGEELDGVTFEYDTGGIRIVPDGTVITIGENDLGLEEGTTTWQTANANESYLISEAKEMRFIVDGKEVVVTAAEDSEGIYLRDLIDAGVIKMQSDGTIIANGDISVGYIDGGEDIEDGGQIDEAASAFLKHVFNGKDTGIKGARDSDILTEFGTNSVIEVSSDGKNFIKYTSSSNLFTFDGTTIDVSKAGEFDAGENEDDYITIETVKDVSGLMDVIKGFVNDYNTLLSDLYGEMGTSRPKSQGDYYNPLTEDQEEEMTEKEIEKWNEQAKIGLLYNDPNIQKFVSSLRSAMNTYVDGFGLRDMGINLTSDWSDNGKLEIDESKLEAALNAYGDKVADFFTNASKGLAANLENVVDKAISTKTKSYGYLSSLAGIDGTKTDKDNQIYRQIESIKSIIDKLNEKYEKEQERYWSKFTALETYMAKMQSQMSYFTDMGTSDSSY